MLLKAQAIVGINFVDPLVGESSKQMQSSRETALYLFDNQNVQASLTF